MPAKQWTIVRLQIGIWTMRLDNSRLVIADVSPESGGHRVNENRLRGRKATAFRASGSAANGIIHNDSSQQVCVVR